MSRPSIITIGSFDGVHLGHAALVRRAVELRTGDARVVVMAFDPHPMTLLVPERAPARLTMFERRVELLRELGADEVVRLSPTPELLDTPPEEFIAGLVERLNPRAFVEGPDFGFGRGRAGNVALLRELGARSGFAVHIVEPVDAVLGDHSLVRASSTIARWLVRHGRARDAAAVLGRPYEVEGVVVEGDRRGRAMGYPTANLRTECLLPADGVYAGSAMLEDGRRFPAAISVGNKPQFGGSHRVMEAHLLRVGGDCGAIAGLPEYGWRVRIGVNAWLREQMTFGSVEELMEQMALDCERALAAPGRVMEGADA